MKKFIKWFLFWLSVGGGLALAICYMVIPEQTKSAVDIVVGYLNTPLGIVGGTTITIGMVAYIVVSNLLKLNRDKAKQDFEECKKELEDKKQEFSEHIERIALEQKKLYECLKELEKANVDFDQFTIDTLKLIPNKKVQERLEQLYGKDQERTND